MFRSCAAAGCVEHAVAKLDADSGQRRTTHRPTTTGPLSTCRAFGILRMCVLVSHVRWKHAQRAFWQFSHACVLMMHRAQSRSCSSRVAASALASRDRMCSVRRSSD